MSQKCRKSRPDTMFQWRRAGSRPAGLLDGEQSVEEFPVPAERDPEILGGSTLVGRAALQLAALAAEHLLQLIEYLADQAVDPAHGVPRVIDEFALELVPAILVCGRPVRRDERLGLGRGVRTGAGRLRVGPQVRAVLGTVAGVGGGHGG